MGVGLLRVSGEMLGKFLTEGLPAVKPLRPLTDVKVLSACVTEGTGEGRETIDLIISSPDLQERMASSHVPVLELEFIVEPRH